MFGFLEVNQDELKIKEYKAYRAYYCGVCHELRKKALGLGGITLSYDLTFVAMLLDGLFDTEKEMRQERCQLHPLKKHCAVLSEAVKYAADMNLLLAYDNFRDKWYDSKSLKGVFGLLSFGITRRRLAKVHKPEAEAITEYTKRLRKLEKENCPDFEAIANETGIMFGKILSGFSGEWKEELDKLGFFLGKYIYLADAYCDFNEDKKKKKYNPFLASGKDRDAAGVEALKTVAADAARCFERLPVVDNIEIMRNILFSGIWGQVNKKSEGLKNRHDKSV